MFPWASKSKDVGLFDRAVSKISNLHDPDPPTFQTDGYIDGWTDVQSQDRALHYCASRGKNTVTHTLI